MDDSFFGLRQYARHNRVADNTSRVSVILLSRKRFEQMIEDKGERKKYMSIQLYIRVRMRECNRVLKGYTTLKLRLKSSRRKDR